MANLTDSPVIMDVLCVYDLYEYYEIVVLLKGVRKSEYGFVQFRARCLPGGASQSSESATF